MIICFAKSKGGERCTQVALEGNNYCAMHRDLFLAAKARKQQGQQQQQQQIERDGIQMVQQQQQE